MFSRWTRSVVSVTVVGLMFVSPVGAQFWQAQTPSQVRERLDGFYERGFREGSLRAEQDARQGRPFAPETNAGTRRGGMLSDSRSVNQRPDASAFHRGYADGYRSGYRVGQSTPAPGGGALRRQDPWFGQAPRGVRQEPASARGYSDGFKRGLDDGRSGDRYDAVGSREYRTGDAGYYREYGSRDAYRNNYRAGFRQGYEDGYRDGTGSARR
jgi:hypothetical protein